jgi:hypothetical protein
MGPRLDKGPLDLHIAHSYPLSTHYQNGAFSNRRRGCLRHSGNCHSRSSNRKWPLSTSCKGTKVGCRGSCLDKQRYVQDAGWYLLSKTWFLLITNSQLANQNQRNGTVSNVPYFINYVYSFLYKIFSAQRASPGFPELSKGLRNT